LFRVFYGPCRLFVFCLVCSVASPSFAPNSTAKLPDAPTRRTRAAALSVPPLSRPRAPLGIQRKRAPPRFQRSASPHYIRSASNADERPRFRSRTPRRRIALPNSYAPHRARAYTLRSARRPLKKNNRKTIQLLPAASPNAARYKATARGKMTGGTGAFGGIGALLPPTC